MVDPIDLEADYCPPIDTALYSAIVSDFDLTTEEGITAARATLDPLKESAELEEAAGFDPSGVGSNDAAESAASSKHDRSVFDSQSRSAETDGSSLSQRFSPLNLEDGGHDEVDLDGIDEDTKITLLHDIFGEQISSDAIKTALHKSGGKWHGAMEDLLNQVYFHEADDSDDRSMLTTKGIDGFVAVEGRSSKKRRRPKNRQNRNATDSPLPNTETTESVPSKWQETQKNIEFLSSSLHVSLTVAKTAYNTHHSAMPQAINALLKQHMQEHPPDQAHELVLDQAQDLQQKFPKIDLTYCIAIVEATEQSSKHAREIASALTAPPKQQNGGINIIPLYAAPTDDLIDGSTWQHVPTRKIGPGSSIASVDDLPTDNQAQLYAARQSLAFAQARAAHRRAKSDRHMGGAAAYYAQLGHEYSARAHSANAASADELASVQSSANKLDLHGIDVLNAVRIAQQKVERWWASTAELRASGRVGAAERGAGFSIVVGRGTHSEGGKGKLGPAVSKMLRSEGWRFENEGAVIVVRGRQKT